MKTLAFCFLLLLFGAVTIRDTNADAPPFDPDWRTAPAYTLRVPSDDFRTLPRGVCPFGISDLAAYRADGRRVDRRIGYVPINRDVFNYARGTVRVFVFCDPVK